MRLILTTGQLHKKRLVCREKKHLGFQSEYIIQYGIFRSVWGITWESRLTKKISRKYKISYDVHFQKSKTKNRILFTIYYYLSTLHYVKLIPTIPISKVSQVYQTEPRSKLHPFQFTIASMYNVHNICTDTIQYTDYMGGFSCKLHYEEWSWKTKKKRETLRFINTRLMYALCTYTLYCNDKHITTHILLIAYTVL